MRGPMRYPLASRRSASSTGSGMTGPRGTTSPTPAGTWPRGHRARHAVRRRSGGPRSADAPGARCARGRPRADGHRRALRRRQPRPRSSPRSGAWATSSTSARDTGSFEPPPGAPTSSGTASRSRRRTPAAAASGTPTRRSTHVPAAAARDGPRPRKATAARSRRDPGTTRWIDTPTSRRRSSTRVEDEFFTPEWERFVAREMLGVEPIEIPGGHFPMAEDPDRLAGVLDRLSA